MAQELIVQRRRELEAMSDQFGAIIGRSGIDLPRFMTSIMYAVEINPKLAECEIGSLKRFGMTCASLLLDPNPASQQIFALPFKNRKLGVTLAQTVVGYHGYNTLGWRDGLTITGSVVREEDAFSYDEGDGQVSHIKKLGHTLERRIIGAWAKGAAIGRAPMLVVLDIDELEAVRAKAPGRNETDSPWNDPKVGLPAMYAKTAKRRLSRSMPFGAYLAAAKMEEAFEERGLPAHIEPGLQLVVGDQRNPLPRAQPQPEGQDLTMRPQFPIYKSADHAKKYLAVDIDEWRSRMLTAVDAMKSAEALEAFREWNALFMDDLRNRADERAKEAADVVGAAIDRKLKGG